MTKRTIFKPWKPLGGPLVLTLCMLLPYSPQAKETGGTEDALKKRVTVKRDPFWPIGYLPKALKKEDADKPEKEAKALTYDWNGAMKKIVINGVSSRSQDEFYAVINGQVKSVGDTVTVRYDESTFTWAVESIKQPGSVKLRRVSAR